MKRLFLVLPVIALIFALSCDVVFDTTAEESYDEEFAATDYWRIDLDNEAGDVIVTTAATDMIKVSYTKRCKGTNENDAEKHLNDIDILLEGNSSTGEITITADFPNVDIAREYEVVFTITMPDSIELDIVNTTGDIDITGLDRAPTLETTTGSITLKNLTCEVDAKVTTGDIDCHIDSLPSTGDVNLEATTGEQTLVIAAMDTTVASNIDITGTSGSVDMTLPPYAQLEFDMEVTTGEVRIIGYAVYEGTPYSNKHKVGTIGDYEVKSSLEVTTTTGDITLTAGS